MRFCVQLLWERNGVKPERRGLVSCPTGSQFYAVDASAKGPEGRSEPAFGGMAIGVERQGVGKAIDGHPTAKGMPDLSGGTNSPNIR